MKVDLTYKSETYPDVDLTSIRVVFDGTPEEVHILRTSLRKFMRENHKRIEY